MIIENIIDFHQINNKLIGGGTSKKNELMYTKLFMYKTNNDLKCLLIPLLNSTTVTVGFFIPSGSRNEKDAFGIAHFLEHMTFKGTINRTSTQLMLQLDSMGAH